MSHSVGNAQDTQLSPLSSEARYRTLRTKERRGSKARCHLLTDGTRQEVAARLTAVIAPWGVVSADDHWMPAGFDNLVEAQLHKAHRLLPEAMRTALGGWWLPPGQLHSRTPNFDIASTCEIGESRQEGLLLVEAKAHDEELIKECAGRRLDDTATEGRRASHLTIGAAIQRACDGLQRATSLRWDLHRDRNYQMSNRFAWSWKLADLGVPVILVYLGLLNADEMSDRGNPLRSAAEWRELVLTHSQPLFPGEVWNRNWLVNGKAFIPVIQSVGSAVPAWMKRDWDQLAIKRLEGRKRREPKTRD